LFPDLRTFIERLRRDGDIVTVEAQVDRHLEAAEIHRRVIAAGGPALMFTNVRGSGFGTGDSRSPFRLVTNLFGTARRAELAFGERPLRLIRRVVELAETLLPPTPAKLWGARDIGLDLLKVGTRKVQTGPVVENVTSDVNLNQLPVITCWPDDGGKYITFPLVFTKDPETGMRNIGTYRMQVFDGRTTGMHWQRHKGGAQHYRIAERLGRRLEVAVALSAEPVLPYCATAPMPEGLDELLLGGLLSHKRIELVKCVTVDLEVPASAHIVLEGYVEPGERRREGPFGDHTGLYSQPDDFPVFHLTCITRRKRPIYLTTVVGVPPMEDYYLGLASERIFLPMIRKTLPEIVDMHFPAEGIFHNLVIVSIDKRYPGHARKIMNAFWGLGQLMFSKTIVVVDNDVDVHDVSQVAWIVGTHMDPLRDIQMTKGPVDDLDDAADLPAYGGKMGIDATKKWASEGYTRSWPARVKTTEAAGRRAADIWSRLKR
jgi:4-hydroxy-3-polyprenylbenzoate decarboxylase